MIGLILAGGLSSRFGSDKALVTLHGKTQSLLLQLLSLLSSVPGLSGTAVSCRAEQVLRLKTFVSTRFVLDHRSNVSGDYTPLYGIISALEELNDSLLVIPCDLPFMTLETLTRLTDARSRKLTAETLRTSFIHEDGMLEPLVAIYEKKALPFLKSALQEKHWAIHAAIPPQRQILAPCSNRAAFFNMNTLNDFQEAQRLQRIPLKPQTPLR